MTTTQELTSREEHGDQQQLLKPAVAVVLLAQLVLGLMYVVHVPLWMPSDERAHMRYIMDLAGTGHLHVMSIGDQSYETHQPPFFYVLAAFLYLLIKPLGTATAGYLLRTMCLICHTGATILVADIFRRHLRQHLWLALAGTTFFALSPVLLAINATVSNDSLAFLLTVFAFWIFSRYGFHITSEGKALLLGGVIGLALLTKLAEAPVLLLVLVYLGFDRSLGAPKKLRLLCSTLLPVFLLLAPWLLWNHSVYGAWTGAGRLYGPGVAYAQHPQPVHSIHALNVKSKFAYHFLPVEFWLNQFHVPKWLAAGLIVLTLYSGTGLTLVLRRFRSLEPNYASLISLSIGSYALFFLSYLFLEVKFTAGPVRWIFGDYFAFALLWCAGIDAWDLMKGRRNSLGAFIATVSCCLLTNTYLIAIQVPRLQGFGLHP